MTCRSLRDGAAQPHGPRQQSSNHSPTLRRTKKEGQYIKPEGWFTPKQVFIFATESNTQSSIRRQR